MLQTANTLRDQGVSCIPCDHKKRPNLVTWKPYQDTLPTPEKLHDWFDSSNSSLAIVAGEVQCIDIDCKHDAEIAERYRQRCKSLGLEETFERCIMQKTPSGGFHLVFKCSAELRNLKLARNENKEVILETRGAGGYFLAYPSAGYELVRGRFEEIPTLAEEERDDLLAVARSFDFAPKEAREERSSGMDQTPGDAFDERAEIEMPHLLIRHGWTQVANSKYWTRPGKKSGISASWGHIPGRFWVFTTSSDFEAEHVYRPWHVYAILEHGGDFGQAARELSRQGYGAPAKKPDRVSALDEVRSAIEKQAEPKETKKEAPKIDLPPILSIDEEEFQDWDTPPQLIEGVLYEGSKLMLAAPSKARKSFVLTDLALSVGSGMPWLGWQCEQRPVLVLNFELQNFAARNRRQDIEGRKFKRCDPLVYSWHLRGALSRRGFSPAMVYGEITRRMEQFCKTEGVGLVIIDPVYKLMQLAGEENKAEDVGKLLNELEAISYSTGAAVAFAHHFAKGNASAKEASDRASGSGVFARDPDALITLTPHSQEDCMVVDATLRNFKAPESFGVRWKYPLWERDDKLNPSDLKRAKGGPSKLDLGAELLGLLPEEGLTATEWQSEAKDVRLCESTKFYEQRRKLIESGAVRIEGKRYYRA